jgi:hypothetical protein
MAGTVAKRVTAALDAVSRKDPEQGLHDICGVIESTAKAEYGAGGRKNYKDFIKDHLTLITWASGFPPIGKMRFAYQHPNIDPDAAGTCGIEDVIDHAVRCGLYHAGEWPDSLKFEDSRQIRLDGSGNLFLPMSLVNGLIMLVVTSPANKGESITDTYKINSWFTTLPINNLWGKRAELMALQAAEATLHNAVQAIVR